MFFQPLKYTKEEGSPIAVTKPTWTESVSFHLSPHMFHKQTAHMHCYANLFGRRIFQSVHVKSHAPCLFRHLWTILVAGSPLSFKYMPARATGLLRIVFFGATAKKGMVNNKHRKTKAEIEPMNAGTIKSVLLMNERRMRLKMRGPRVLREHPLNLVQIGSVAEVYVQADRPLMHFYAYMQICESALWSCWSFFDWISQISYCNIINKYQVNLKMWTN